MAPMGGSAAGRERGQAVPLIVMVLAAIAVAVVGTAQVGGRVVDRARAQTAADAAALAGVTGGRIAADELARRNGGSVVDFHSSGQRVQVRVRVGAVLASASAEWTADPAVP